MRSKGAVAAGHPLTAKAASDVLDAGGNAYDAAIAGMCAACVAEPVLASLGGGGFLLARQVQAPPVVYDFFVQTPRDVPPSAELDFPEMHADFGAVRQKFHYGLGSIATPGIVKGIFEIHRDLGSLPIADVLAPAIELAERGAALNAFQASVLRLVGAIYRANATTREMYRSPRSGEQLIGGGELLRMPQLAATLRELAQEGEDLFYRGAIAQTIAKQCREGGGCLTAADLENYEVVRRPALRVTYRDTEVFTNPPPSIGGTLIGFSLELLGVQPHTGHAGSAEDLERLTRVMALTNEARFTTAGHGEELALGLADPQLVGRFRDDMRKRPRCWRGTTHITVLDTQRNVATLTLSNGEGSGHLIPDTGIMLNNMLGEEDLVPEGFHRWSANQRMSSMMAPTLARFDDGRLVAMGSGGSKRIRTAILQVLVNLIDHRMSVEEAVAQPRLFLEDDSLSIEGGFDPAQLSGLLQAYPDSQTWEQLSLFFGGVHSVELADNQFRGAGDPRRGGVFLVI